MNEWTRKEYDPNLSAEDRKKKYYSLKTTAELKKELDVLLCMDNNGGMLANDLIEEIDKREPAKPKDKKTNYNTNLASEYLILSMLYRLGLDAYITLGNKKSIDIIVKNRNRTITIDVKGLAGKTGFPLDNFNHECPTFDNAKAVNIL
jgi:hypothetical protein